MCNRPKPVWSVYGLHKQGCAMTTIRVDGTQDIIITLSNQTPSADDIQALTNRMRSNAKIALLGGDSFVDVSTQNLPQLMALGLAMPTAIAISAELATKI